MAKSIIVYGVPGGKTRFAERIADHFGLTLVTFGDGSCYLPHGHLYTAIWQKNNGVCEERSFQSVADEINASIPLTDWQSGPPPMVGEWDTYCGLSCWRRYWTGKNWSRPFDEKESQKNKNYLAKRPSIYTRNSIQWRGLSQEPIKVTE